MFQLFSSWNPLLAVAWFSGLSPQPEREQPVSFPTHVAFFLTEGTVSPGNQLHLVLTIVYAGFLMQLMATRFVGACCPSNAGVLALNAIVHAIEIPFFLSLGVVEGISRMQAAHVAVPELGSIAVHNNLLSFDGCVAWAVSIVEILYGFVVLPPCGTTAPIAAGQSVWDGLWLPEIHVLPVVVFGFIVLNPFIFAAAAVAATAKKA